ncbi:MAG: aspartate 1-decarboxylase [Acidobacteria bacterium]|nr:aspartate 1-decarboxylase [Acidobacteriota bacterium]
MLRTMMRAKLHGATVTQVDLHYVGSITLDAELMEKLDILPNERVQVLNVNNGARLETYVIPGERGSGVVGLNGAAARLAQLGDKILVVTYALMSDEEARSHRSKVAVLDDHNRIAEIRQDVEIVVPRMP